MLSAVLPSGVGLCCVVLRCVESCCILRLYLRFCSCVGLRCVVVCCVMCVALCWWYGFVPLLLWLVVLCCVLFVVALFCVGLFLWFNCVVWRGVVLCCVEFVMVFGTTFVVLR